MPNLKETDQAENPHRSSESALNNLVMCDQLLALLVMDFGYLEEPVYGHSPLRHQIAWRMCADEIGADDMIKKVADMNEQAEREAPKLTGMLKTFLSAAETNNDIVVTKVGDT